MKEFTSNDTASGEVKEFTTNRKPIEFKLDGETMKATPEIPAEVMLNLIDARETLKHAGTRGRIEVLIDVLDDVLYPESISRIRERMKSREEPLGVPKIVEIVEWLMGECYGMRPTQSPRDSEHGPESTGQSSTDGASPEVLTPEDSPGPDSSTSSTTTSPEETRAEEPTSTPS